MGPSQPAREGRGPVRISPQLPPIFSEEEMGEGLDQRGKRQVWTSHLTQTQRTRAADGRRAGRGAGSCFLGGTGSHPALSLRGRSGNLASSWHYSGREMRAFLLVWGVLGNSTTMGTGTGRRCYLWLGPGRLRNRSGG